MTREATAFGDSARTPAVRFAVGDLVVDLGRQQVSRDGAVIPLPKLTFDLFMALVRAAPNLLTLDVLMAEVWPGVAVSPETVSQRVKLLRDALGDDARAPRYVAGLRGRGYRLLPDVVALREPQVAEAPSSPTPAEPAPEPSPAGEAPRRLRDRPAWLLTLVSLVAIAAASTLWLRRSADTPPPAELGQPRSVAVLPFENLSDDPRDRYLAPGIAEVVQHRLASHPELLVIASTSSFAIRERESDLREIGRRLGARYLVDGSVLRAGDRLRVTAHIIDAQNAAQLRSLRFDREIEDIVRIEDEVAAGVADAFALTLAPSPASAAGRSADLDAHLAYLQGKHLLASYRVADAKAAIAKFVEAYARDPGYAAAFWGEAEARERHAWLSAGDPLLEHGEITRLLDRALALDPLLGEAIALRAGLTGDEAGLRRGLALAPSNGRGYELLANLLWDQGRDEEARRTIELAKRLDPLTPRNHYLEGLDRLHREDLDAAEASFASTLELDPQFLPAIARLGTVESMRGHFAQAVRRYEQALALDPDALFVSQDLAIVYLDLGEVEAARSVGTGIEVALYEGRTDRALAIAAALPDETRRYHIEPSVLAFVIRDEGLRTSDEAGALRSLDWIAGPDSPPAPDKILASAHLLLRIGDAPQAEAQLRELAASCERTARGRSTGCLRRLAAVSAIRGDDEAALTLLTEWASRRQGFDWYVLARDPAFARLRGSPRFEALMARSREHAASERALLETLRAQGDVPRRSAARDGLPRALLTAEEN